MPATIFEIVAQELSKPIYTYEGKDLLITKLEYASSFEEAYLTDDEKEMVNRVLEIKNIPVRIQ
jgi:CBS domain containing-hemolysin-like protein